MKCWITCCQTSIFELVVMKNSLTILFFILCLGCSENSKEKFVFDFPSSIKVLGHKGSGTHGQFGNKFHDNSAAGILNAIEKLDGAELDLQMSLDSTLWLFHDHVMLDCNGNLVNIATITDSSIEAYGACNYSSEIARFEDLVKVLDRLKDTTKTLSLDLKVLQNPESIKAYGGEAELALFVAERIKNYLLKNNNIFIEVPFSSQVDIMESITGKTTFLIQNSFEYLRQSLRMNHSAPIHHFYTDVPELFESYGQKSLLWVVNSADEMMNALALRPTAIQTDNIPMVQFFRKLPRRGQVVETATYSSSDTLSDFFILMDFNKNIEENQLLEVNFGQNNMEGIHLVFSSTNQFGEGTKWKSVPIHDSTHYFFLGKLEHELLGSKNYKIYLWNPNGGFTHFRQDITLRTINNTVK